MGRLILPENGPVYLDANCFIYSVERIEPYCPNPENPESERLMRDITF